MSDIEGVDVLLGDGSRASLADVLEATDDPCFGRLFSSSAEECQECTWPTVVEERVVTCRDLCRRLSDPKERLAVKMGYRDVARRLVDGMTTDEIAAEMAGTDDPDVVAAARSVLSSRLSYMRNQKGWSVPTL